MIASIIVDIENRKLNHIFDYLIPEDFSIYLKKGMRVIVPFGPRKVLGYVIEVKKNSNYRNLKSIISIVDVEPILTDELIKLAYFMENETSCLLVSAIQAILPNVLKLKYFRKIIVLDENKADQLLIELSKKNKITNKDFYDNYSKIQKNIQNNFIKIENKIMTKTNILKEKIISLVTYKHLKSVKQMEIIDFLNDGEASFKKLLSNGFSKSSISTLIKKGLVESKEIDGFREIKHIFSLNKKTIILNDTQKETIKKISSSNKPVLLHGVTGSGKTEVYINVIEAVIKSGKQAIMMVPEISLTPQMINQFKKRFNDIVAIMHSKISDNELYDEWRRIKSGEAKIVVGTRMSIFAPFDNIGVIIIDEEHDSSYIQQDEPKYNTVDIAIYRAKLNNSKLVLGSATPNVNDYHKAKKNIYELISMPKRVNDNKWPKIELVDMAEELKSGNRKVFSKIMIKRILECLNKSEQAIILINRRGYSSFVMCRECGYVIKCPKCDITLTHHLDKNNLECHHCGYNEKMVARCPKCDSMNIRQMGIGTQKVVSELSKLFPKANIGRMDADNTTKKMAVEEILYDFSNHKIDILVGTQMISKGLDFPNVTFVGILMADMILKLPNHLNAERTFQLIMQVSGRAGRSKKDSHVVVQSYNTNHYSIRLAISNNYEMFYNNELSVRELLDYPPFVKMKSIIVSHKFEKGVYFTANKIVAFLKEDKRLTVYGPAKAKVYLYNSKFRLNILIKYGINVSIKSTIDEMLEEFTNSNDIIINIENE